MVFDVILESLATFMGVFGSVAMIPQVYRIFKRKNAKDISIWTYSYMLAAGVVWVLYGFNIESFPIVISNLIGSIVLVGMVFGWVMYGR